MVSVIVENELKGIEEKVKSGTRLTRDEGILLMKHPDILSVGALADMVRRRKWGNKAFYTTNLNINYTNVCITEYCLFCSFARLPGQEGGWTWSLEEIEAKVRDGIKKGLVEVHVVGGLNPKLKFDYYLEMFRMIKRIDPKIYIKAFTAVEIDFFAREFHLTIEEVFRQLKDAGMDAMPGGGAEVLSERVHQKIYKDKIGPARWLEIHQIAHGLGFRTNATILYGHIETDEERVDHFIRLRELQDKTGGFLAFVPLAFQPENNRMSKLPEPHGLLDLKVIAVSRLMLDNFDHIKALWTYLKPKLAQASLSFGADDLGGTLVGETIARMAGSRTPEELEREELQNIIRTAGMEPIEVNTFYQPVTR